ncbi:MAG: carboxypeptidase-like regulatory domain-containing protein, partial [Actinomycetota bacterium]
ATITVTADKSALGAIQAVVYSGSFNPAIVGTNYLADPGFIAIVSPGYPGVFSVNVPAGGTIVIVVVELKSPANGFPSAVGTTYTLDVAGLPLNLAPTAAQVAVSGKVSANGRGLGNGRVTITDDEGKARSTSTNSFGYFHFDGVEAGKTYVFQVKHKEYTFGPQIISINDNVADLNFEAQ